MKFSPRPVSGKPYRPPRVEPWPRLALRIGIVLFLGLLISALRRP